MPIFIGFYRNKSGKIKKINEVAFHQNSSDKFFVAYKNTISGKSKFPNKTFINYLKIVVRMCTIFGNRYNFIVKDLIIHPKLMEDCVFS